MLKTAAAALWRKVREHLVLDTAPGVIGFRSTHGNPTVVKWSKGCVQANVADTARCSDAGRPGGHGMKPSPYFDGSTGRKYGYGPGSRTVIEFEAPRSGSHGTEQLAQPNYVAAPALENIQVQAGKKPSGLTHRAIVVSILVPDTCKVGLTPSLGVTPDPAKHTQLKKIYFPTTSYYAWDSSVAIEEPGDNHDVSVGRAGEQQTGTVLIRCMGDDVAGDGARRRLVDVAAESYSTTAGSEEVQMCARANVGREKRRGTGGCARDTRGTRQACGREAAAGEGCGHGVVAAHGCFHAAADGAVARWQVGVLRRSRGADWRADVKVGASRGRGVEGGRDGRADTKAGARRRARVETARDERGSAREEGAAVVWALGWTRVLTRGWRQDGTERARAWPRKRGRRGGDGHRGSPDAPSRDIHTGLRNRQTM
ncbi:hypothetical protein DFH08DRAFT_944538 [Mycena albidolilacea]|uniref:Uncharacterized protein n=1 Tax=Mycena albidolilacea TaxID=1033008 RepID=A0AAD7EAQ1_9AGAR|nr:hypothetical protein DFH08DRAFT_944538 [Mycena albidolilacea]